MKKFLLAFVDNPELCEFPVTDWKEKSPLGYSAFKGEVSDSTSVKHPGEEIENEVGHAGKKEEEEVESQLAQMLYRVEDTPPWFFSILLGFQHFLTMVGGTISAPYLLGRALCMTEDDPARGELLSTILFVNGLITILQSTLGVRLPIIQGGTFALVIPILSILSQPEWKCPSNMEQLSEENKTIVWTSRVHEIQGALLVASLVEVVLGGFGIVGAALRFITPLTVAPAITMIGLALFPVAGDMLAAHWPISLTTVALVTLLSQHLHGVWIPCFPRGSRFPIFKLFPVLLSILIMWGISGILTETEVLPPDSQARTDIKWGLLQNSPWFRIPYPFQWGVPSIAVGAAFGLMAGLLASAIESIGDYYACARIAGAPPPPVHAINRGIFIEGIGCFIAAMFGSINGTTSFGENIGAIGVTKVGSRRVVQIAGVVMMVAGMFGKLGALFVTIPEPVIGGVFCVMFGIVTAVGVSNLQYVDLNSSRNMFVFGVSIFLGLTVPSWMRDHPRFIQTGSEKADQIISILLNTQMFIAGFTGFFLDNTIPGSAKERGLIAWQNQGTSTKEEATDGASEPSTCYDLPFGMHFLRRHKWTEWIPILPVFRGWKMSSCCPRKRTSQNV